MILDFESIDATKAQNLLEDLTVIKIQLETFHATLLDSENSNIAGIISNAAETIDDAIEFLDEILED